MRWKYSIHVRDSDHSREREGEATPSLLLLHPHLADRPIRAALVVDQLKDIVLRVHHREVAHPCVTLRGFPSSGDTRDLVGLPLPPKPQRFEVSLFKDRDHINRLIEVVIQPTLPVFPPLDCG